MKSVKPIIAAKALQVFHGWDIYVESRTYGPGTRARVWEVRIPALNFRMQGNHAEIVKILEAYSAGYTAGRKYSVEEQSGLKTLIADVEHQFVGRS